MQAKCCTMCFIAGVHLKSNHHLSLIKLDFPESTNEKAGEKHKSRSFSPLPTTD